MPVRAVYFAIEIQRYMSQSNSNENSVESDDDVQILESQVNNDDRSPGDDTDQTSNSETEKFFFRQHKISSLNILIIVYLFQNAKRYRDRSHRRVLDIGVRLLSRLRRETAKQLCMNSSTKQRVSLSLLRRRHGQVSKWK